MSEEQEDVLPETSPDAEDVFDADMRRPHMPLREAGAVPFEDRSDVDDLDDQKRVLWQARVRAGVQFAGRLVRELGRFLTDFDAWEPARKTPAGPHTVEQSLPERLQETVLPLRAKDIMLPDGSYLMSGETVMLPPGATATMLGRPQAIFRGERVVIPETEAEGFLILDIKIGRNSQFVASGPIPAVVFSEKAFGVRLKFETAQVSQDVIVVVQNVSKEARKPPGVLIVGMMAY